MSELEMHKKLKSLFENIFPDRQVYIGQGTGEYGKDLVIIEKNPLSGEKVTALVVKMGDLQGSASSGMVSTINTQINQAFNIPTFFKQIGKSVVADEVIIVIFGNISQNAENNLNGFLKGYPIHTIKTKSLDDMTELFEKYYDDVFVTTSEIDDLHKKHEKLEKILYEKHKFLATCYIEPNIKTFESTRRDILLAQNTGNLPAETIKETIFGKRDTISGVLEKALSRKHFMLIEGEAGSGKSIFTIKMVQHSIEEMIKHSAIRDSSLKIKAPILLKSTKLKSLTNDALHKNINLYYTNLKTNIEPSMLIIDGIDEVCESDRKNIVALSENFCHSKNISLIITTRKNQDIVKELKNYSRLELLPFEMSQAIEFIKRMAAKNQSLVQGLLKNLEDLQHQIPMSPMSLALLVEIAEKHNEIPASISDLYDRYVNMIIGVDNSDTEINQLFEPRYKLDFLITISYELFFLHNNSTVTKECFNDYVNEYILKHSHISSKEDFLSDLKRISILAINDSIVTFSHKSFLDYFIAKYFSKNTEELFRKDDFDQVYQLYYTALWEDVTNFYFGSKNNITKEQINRLIENNPHKTESPLMYNLELYSIGKLLQYAWNTDNQTKKYGINMAISNVLTLREEIDKLHKSSFGISTPKLFADAALMHYTDFYFSSNFLRTEVLEIIDENFKMFEDSNGNADILNELYFFGVYMLANAKKVSIAELEKFTGQLLSMEDKVEPTVFYPIAHLFKVFVNTTKLKVSQDKIEALNNVFKTFRKKYKFVFNENLLFKNKVEARQYKTIVHHTKKK